MAAVVGHCWMVALDKRDQHDVGLMTKLCVPPQIDQHVESERVAIERDTGCDILDDEIGERSHISMLGTPIVGRSPPPLRSSLPRRNPVSVRMFVERGSFGPVIGLRNPASTGKLVNFLSFFLADWCSRGVLSYPCAKC